VAEVSDTPRAIAHAVPAALARCELTFVARRPIDVGRARAQHRDYCALLMDCGLAVEVVDSSPDHPDAVFVEDAAVVLDEVAVACAMGAPSRRGEVEALLPALARHRPVRRMGAGTLEGGDVLRVGRTLFVGRSARTDDAGIAALAAIAGPLGYRVVPALVRGCLHLKTACTALADDVLLANPMWVDLAPFAGMRVVDVDPAEPFAANVLRLSGALVASASHARTAARVRALGLPLRTTDIGEFEKAEGGPTCLSLVIAGPAPPPRFRPPVRPLS
jgi:dimethylargininase